MKIAGGAEERGVVIGNTYDKYGSRNPIVRRMMRGFAKSLDALVDEARPGSIHEVGCGEGYWVLEWHRRGLQVRGSDFAEAVIRMARENARDRGMPESLFRSGSIYDLDPAEDAADIVVCCEVLEHLEKPELALQNVARLARRHAIFSVPREPLWRCLNMARGKYWSDFGNTPGHLQGWSTRQFVDLVSRHFNVVRVETPLPWTMLLCTVTTPKD